ncbi:MAG: hypothetical protein ACT4QG_12510 [Sporichthyaceae bacterium]
MTLVGPGDTFGDRAEALLLLNLETGRKRRLPGLQVVDWNPEGTRLLARRIAPGVRASWCSWTP